MSDNRQISGSPDSQRININQDYEVRYWTRALGVTAETLRKAVAAAGTSADAVRKYLKVRRNDEAPR